MYIQVFIDRQVLELYQDQSLIKTYLICTAKLGTGENMGSYQTPRGAHYIRAKVGADAPLGMAFRARRATGIICTEDAYRTHPNQDWITTRILWLCGLEVGKNRGAQVDTFRRFIYIHGTPDWESMDMPQSHGCIRMRNKDIAELFDLVPAYTPVTIFESGL